MTDPVPDLERLSRRELLAAGMAAGAALTVGEGAGVAAGSREWRTAARIDFTREADGGGWGRGWRSLGVANLRRDGGLGILEAGSDVFPNDPRPVAFALDARATDVRVTAEIARIGGAPGVVARRTGPRVYYAAIYDTGRLALRLFRREGADLLDLSSTPVLLAAAPVKLALETVGHGPTELRAELVDANGRRFTATARDGSPSLQRPGDAGVLASAETIFPSDRNPVLPALGNLHLLPWGIQEGQAVMETAVGEAIVGEIRRLSTAGFREVRIETPGRPRRSRPAVIAATTGAPVPGGARLQVACDLPAEVEIELSYSRRFERSWKVRAGRTGDFHATTKTVRGLEEGRRVHWRARVRRHGKTTTSPARSFRVLPRSGSREAISLAVASCGSQFGPIFGHLAARRPDVFVWQGDLNYPDTHGPLAQTVSGYAGIWRDFLANPVLEPILERAAFAAQRDDHDYAIQDANARVIAEHPWGLGPWNALMNRRTHYRFPAGAAEVWVIDQRRFKTDPQAPASPAKTLLGRRQRRWLLETLAASRARFKVICSPTSVFMAANPRDGSWAAGFEAERDLLLRHIRRHVGGTTIFLTGDVHLTGVHEGDRWFEARAAPVGIPTPNDVTLLDPLAASNLARRPGVVYADDRCHLAMVTVRGVGREARLELELLREDGAVPYRRVFEAS